MSRILIVGATGQQGGSVLSALEGQGHDLVALVRKQESEAAQALVARGVSLAVGDLSDQHSIEQAMQGADAAFLVTSPFVDGTDAETRYGITGVDAAAAVGLPFLVYSSVASADENTGIAHFDSKYAVEQRMAEKGLRSAVIAPTFFMDNFTFPWNIPGYLGGLLREALPPETPLQMVSVVDVGRSAAAALQDPDRYAGERIELAGDEVTGPQMAETLGGAMGHSLTFEQKPLEETTALGDDMKDMYAWFASTGYSADKARQAELLPDISFATLKQWAEDQDWQALLASGATG